MFRTSKVRMLSFLFWFGVIFISTALFALTSHVVPSFIIFVINIAASLLAIYLTKKETPFFLFSPVMQTLFQIINFIGLQGLFYFSRINKIILFKIPTNNEFLLSEICFFYLIFVSCIIFPYIYFSWRNKKPRFELKILKRQFNYHKVVFYLIFSQIILFLLLALIFIFTKISPIDALMNCLGFRFAYTHGVANYIFVFFKIFLVFNMILLLKMLLVDKVKNKTIYILSTIFFIFYIFWFLISGSRGFLLILLLYTIYVIFLDKNIEIKFKQILLGLTFSVIIVSVLAVYSVYRNLANDISKGYSINQMSIQKLIENTEIINNTLERNDAFANSVRYLVYVDNKDDSIFFNVDTHIKEVYTYPFVNMIPRRVLPEKGHFTHEVLTAKIFPNLVFENVTMLFGGLANLYYTGNLPYIIFDALIFGFFIAILQFSYKRYLNYDCFFVNYVYIIINLISIYFGIGLLNTHVTIPFLLQAIISLLISILLSDNKLSERRKYSA